MVIEKPDVRERLGSALNSSNLGTVEGKPGPVELIAALAFVQMNPNAAEHASVDGATIDPRTELASVLVRIKYGGDRSLQERATRMLVQWVLHQRAYRRWKLRPGGDGLLETFARAGLAEWLDPVCHVCSGRCMLGLERGAVVSKRVRCSRCKGRGELDVRSKKSGHLVRRRCSACHGMGGITLQRTIREKPGECWSCKGTGQHRPSDAEHARALGLDVGVYVRHWAKRFSWLAAALDQLDHTEKRCLQAQMRSGIKADGSGSLNESLATDMSVAGAATRAT